LDEIQHFQKFNLKISFSYYIEQTTGAEGFVRPEKPNFNVEKVESENGYGKAKVHWKPNYAGTPGSHFYVKYRKIGEPTFQTTPNKINDDTIEVPSLEPDEKYEIRVVSVDGNFETESASQTFYSSVGGKFNQNNLNW
jgi:neuronal cell adhesion molecule